MENNRDYTFPRRTFLRGAAGVVGASVLGGLPGEALAALTAFDYQSLTVVYWDGERFVPASSVSSDPTLESVEIHFRGVGGSAGIRSIDWTPTIETPAGPIVATAYAWTAPPRGCDCTKLSATIDPRSGMPFTVMAGGKSPTSVRFSVEGSGAGPKLREGDYVLVATKVDWNSFELSDENESAPIVARTAEGQVAPFQYVLMRVRRA